MHQEKPQAQLQERSTTPLTDLSNEGGAWVKWGLIVLLVIFVLAFSTRLGDWVGDLVRELQSRQA